MKLRLGKCCLPINCSLRLSAVNLAKKVGSLSQEVFDFFGGSPFGFYITDLEPDLPPVSRVDPSTTYG